MGADRHAVFHAEPDHLRHRLGITRMATAGDVGARDQPEDRLFAPIRKGFRPLAHIGIQIDCPGHQKFSSL